MEFPAEFSTSDDLIWLQGLFDKYPAISSLNQFVRVQLIVDANAVFESILWSLRKARKENARPALLELLEAEAISCFAPTFLKEEVVSKIYKRVERYKYSIEIALAIWAKYEKKIRFVDVGGPEQLAEAGGDPKDVPYIKLQQKLSLPIVSADRDIPGMGGNAIKSIIFMSLRKYTRESATVLKLNVVGIFSVTIPVVALIKAVALVQQSISRAASRVPQWVWMAAACLAAILILDPKNREWLVHRVASCTSSVQKAALGVLSALQPVIKEQQRAASAAKQALSDAYEKGVV